MEYHETNIVCTKHHLWKKQTLVLQIVDLLLAKGFTFKDVVLGEPNNFVFADHYDEIEGLLKKKGFYGIRIKVLYNDSLLEINSNMDGINNVQYTIFATSEDSFNTLKQAVQDVREVIKPSNDKIEQASEYIQKHRKLRNIVILLLVAISLYFLGVYVFLFDIIAILFSFSPFLLFFILYIIFRKRY